MHKEFCDRCKKDISNLKTYETSWVSVYSMENEISCRKTLCSSCAIDIMNIIDIECDKYELKTEVIDMEEV